MNEKPKIGIVGLGLIGGSLGLKLVEQGYPIIGIDPNPDQITDHPFELVTKHLNPLYRCDIVFICTPILSVLPTLNEIQIQLKPGAIVSDVGSVKAAICNKATEIMRADCTFIGGHPMAGTEKIGFANASSELFLDKPWCLMKSQSLQARDLEQVILAAGARPVYASPEEHDRAVAMISHLPLLLSIALQTSVFNHPSQELSDLAIVLASSGFESMTRLARGNPELNIQILESNYPNIKLALKNFLDQLKGWTD
ncbi:MAG: prephenate dehydrogenase/arogenate dehydrogenase family protein [Candidatus Caenarcaniphilales bacterium]|nr:prephenate dehydrogenase/arogenate dehydrogenase family protein [Candidatus Caenarcaniphilales bacterium]